MLAKQPYIRPQLHRLGSVADLTRTGKTTDAGDGKMGSADSQGGAASGGQ